MNRRVYVVNIPTYSFKTKPPKCYSTQKKNIPPHSPEFKTFIQTDINIPLVSSGFRVHKLNKNGLFVIQNTV